MAIHSLQMPFARFHGKARTPGTPGGQVLYQTGNVGISRALVNPAQPDSAHQTTIRSLLSTAAAGYKALSAANAASWRAAAADYNRSNILGQDYNLSGIALYCLVNQYRQMKGEALISAPPAVAHPAAPSAVNSAVVGGGNLTVSVTPGGGAGILFVQVTAPLGGSNRLARSSDFRTLSDAFADSFTTIGASPQACVIPIEQFTIIATDYIGVRVVQLDLNYYPSVQFIDQSVLVA